MFVHSGSDNAIVKVGPTSLFTVAIYSHGTPLRHKQSEHKSHIIMCHAVSYTMD